MDENLNILGEQPAEDNVHTVATGVEIGTDNPEGSPLGKFKDANKLLDAYNELQSEFTRKCQRLSDAEKKLQEISSVQNAGVENAANENEFAWNKNIKEFLQSHKNAGAFVEEITKELIDNSDLRGDEKGLELAYSKVLEKNFVPHQELAKDQEFLEKFILNNDEIKEKIIKEYVSSLQGTQSPLILGNTGFNRGVAQKTQVSSLEEAKKYVENMFKF